MSFPQETSLDDVIKYIRTSTRGQAFPDGIPIYIDPLGMQEAERSLNSTVTIDVVQVPLRTSLKLVLKQLGLSYQLKDGLLTITSMDTVDRANGVDETAEPGGTRLAREQAQATGVVGAHSTRPPPATRRRSCGSPTSQSRAHPSPRRTAPVSRSPSPAASTSRRRRDPQLLEVARVELPAEYYAKAVPVLTPRVYRLAKLTNKSDLVPPARRGHGLRRQRFRRPDAPAPGRRR